MISKPFILPKIEVVLVLPYCIYIYDLVNLFIVRKYLFKILIIKKKKGKRKYKGR